MAYGRIFEGSSDFHSFHLPYTIGNASGAIDEAVSSNEIQESGLLCCPTYHLEQCPSRDLNGPYLNELLKSDSSLNLGLKWLVNPFWDVYLGDIDALFHMLVL